MFNEYREIVTVKELCEMLRIGQNKAYELLVRHEIPAIRMGRKYVIAKEHVQSWLRHGDIKSTMRYAHDDIDVKINASERLNSIFVGQQKVKEVV